MPIPAFVSLVFAVVFFLKIWSYAHANRWYRTEAERKAKEKMSGKKSRRFSVPAVNTMVPDTVYPNNLTERGH